MEKNKSCKNPDVFPQFNPVHLFLLVFFNSRLYTEPIHISTVGSQELSQLRAPLRKAESLQEAEGETWQLFHRKESIQQSHSGQEVSLGLKSGCQPKHNGLCYFCVKRKWSSFWPPQTVLQGMQDGNSRHNLQETQICFWLFSVPQQVNQLFLKCMVIFSIFIVKPIIVLNLGEGLGVCGRGSVRETEQSPFGQGF